MAVLSAHEVRKSCGAKEVVGGVSFSIAFGAIGLVVTALARGYDFLTYYFTLLATPMSMSMIGGVFFPAEQLPAAIGLVAQALPLTHAIAVVRPLLLGELPGDVLLHVAVLLAYALGGSYAAIILLRKRLVR